MVSLLAEIPPSGGIILSSFIESISINQDSSLLDYCIMASGLVFLGLILINLYFQLFRMIQKSFLEYWQEPWNWLEFSRWTSFFFLLHILRLSFCSSEGGTHHFCTRCKEILSKL
ncbi:unnamed protein product, partial [Lepidochelys kempii]